MAVMVGYKQTEVGVIPEDWKCSTVRGIASSARNSIVGGPFGSDLGSRDYMEQGVPVIRGQNMNGQWVSGQFVFVTPAKAKSLETNLARPGDIVFTQRGTLGQVSIVPEKPFKAYLVSQSQMKLSVNREAADPLFFYYVFTSEEQQDLIRGSTIQTGVPHINLGILRDIPVQLPLLPEQRAIAKALSDADALIDSLEQLIAKKYDVKQGAMQELLFPKDGWVEKRLGDTATLKARIGWQGLTTAEYLETGDYYLVTGTDFKGGYIDWDHCHYIEEARYGQDKNIQLRQHDVLVTKDGTIGKVALVNHPDKPATLNSGVFVIRPIDGAFHPVFFYYLLCSNVFSEFLAQLSAGSTINHLYQKDFVTFNYKTPITIDEQTAIANILSDMDAEIATLETKLTKTRAIKQGLMHNLLTGKIRLVRPVVIEGEQHIPMSGDTTAKNTTEKSHNWAINEAVVISVLASQFGNQEFPLGRKRYTKLSYLLHRKAEREAQGYLKKAAGPYNPKTKYGGPEQIALKNGYMREHKNGKYKGFIAGEKIEQAKTYFDKWYGPKITAWLEQFHQRTNDDLECLATVDMAMQDLQRQDQTADVASVRALIASEPEWLPKLERTVFSDAKIAVAIAKCKALFGN